MRRDPLEIMEEILKLMDDECEGGECALSLNMIAKKTGIHNVTVRRYIRIIEIIKKEPEIEIIKTGHSIIIRMKR